MVEAVAYSTVDALKVHLEDARKKKDVNAYQTNLSPLIKADLRQLLMHGLERARQLAESSRKRQAILHSVCDSGKDID